MSVEGSAAPTDLATDLGRELEFALTRLYSVARAISRELNDEPADDEALDRDALLEEMRELASAVPADDLATLVAGAGRHAALLAATLAAAVRATGAA